MHGAVRRAVGALAGLAVAPATISHSASRSWIRAFAALPDAGTSGSMARNVTARPPGAARPCDVTLGIPEVGGAARARGADSTRAMSGAWRGTGSSPRWLCPSER